MSDFEARMSVTLPVTKDGILQRECPHCKAQFGVKDNHPSTERILNLRCPSCGMVERQREFATAEQNAYAQALALNELRQQAAQMVSKQVNDMLKGMRSNKFLKITSSGRVPDMDADPIPPPFFDTPLHQKTCPTCSSPYYISDHSHSACPFCR